MQEKLFEITEVRPIELFGVNDSKLKLIRQYFPKLKFVTRDNVIKVSGEPDVIDYFEKKLDLLIRHISRYNTLSEGNIESLLLQKEEGSSSLEDGDVIVHGQGGLQVKARTPNQRKLVRASAENDMVFALGPAGTGKTDSHLFKPNVFGLYYLQKELQRALCPGPGLRLCMHP